MEDRGMDEDFPLGSAELQIVVEHISYQCYRCLKIKFGEYGEWRSCDVVLSYPIQVNCSECLKELATEKKTK